MKKINFNIRHRYNHKIGIFTFSALFFLYLLYLSIPSLYDSGRVQKVLNNKFLTDFDLNISLSTDISYRILPQPHYSIRDTKLFYMKSNISKEIGQIKELKIFISRKNFFDKENIHIRKVNFNRANFFIMKNDLDFIKKFVNKKFSEKKLTITKSKVFLNDDNKNIIFIYSMDKSKFVFDANDNSNFLHTRGKIYQIPIRLDWNKNFTTKKKTTKIITKKINIDLLNEGNLIGEKYEYENTLDFFSSRLKTKYNILDESIVFESKRSLIKSTPIKYYGKIDFKPFNFILNVNANKLDLSFFYKNLYLIEELISTKLIPNENLNGKIYISSKKLQKNKHFDKIDIAISFEENGINLNNTKLYNDKLGTLTIYDSVLKIKNTGSYISAKLKLKIKDKKLFYRSFLIPKKNRKKIKDVTFDIDFHLSNLGVVINNILFEDKNNSVKNFDTVDQIVENNKQTKYNYFNPILLKNFIKKVFIAYSQVG